MKRLINIKKYNFLRNASHDIQERTEAVLYINGEIYMGFSHNDCINLFQKDNNIDQHGGDYKRPEQEYIEVAMETYGFAHLVTYNEFCEQVPLSKDSFDENEWNDLSSNWGESENRVYIETNNLGGISVNDMISACKEQIPRDFDYENLTFWDDDNFTEKIFKSLAGSEILVPVYEKL